MHRTTAAVGDKVFIRGNYWGPTHDDFRGGRCDAVIVTLNKTASGSPLMRIAKPILTLNLATGLTCWDFFWRVRSPGSTGTFAIAATQRCTGLSPGGNVTLGRSTTLRIKSGH